LSDGSQSKQLIIAFSSRLCIFLPTIDVYACTFTGLSGTNELDRHKTILSIEPAMTVIGTSSQTAWKIF